MSLSDTRLRLHSDPYGRYFTRGFVGQTLMEAINHASPDVVVDLGSGDGALSKAALGKWDSTNIITVDLDGSPRLGGKGIESGWSHRHVKVDALRFDLPELLGLRLGQVDVALSNPPYILPSWRPGFMKILAEAGLPLSRKAATEVTADVLFMAQNIRLLRSGGIAGLIVPDGLISGDKLKEIRRALISENNVMKVIKLPRNAFAKTDAQAHIIVLEKGGFDGGKISLQELSENGLLSNEVFVDPEDGYGRLDYTYHFNRQFSRAEKGRRCFELSSVAEIYRGSINNTEAQKCGVPVIHTTGIGHCGPISIDGRIYKANEFRGSGMVLAKKNDILLGRVGRNLAAKIAIVQSGSALVSDCIYVIRSKGFYKEIFQSLSSDEGQAWLNATSHGVGARHIAKSDLYLFPVYISDI